MAGHSKWAQIKYRKALTDAKKAKVFSKIAAMIVVASRRGGGDPAANPGLREAVDKARALNMPQANVERAIARGEGKLPGVSLEPVSYEAYGPGGVAILIFAITDNKNRTLAEVREILNLHGGKLAAVGSVRWLFKEMGKLTLAAQHWSEALELELIDIGATKVKDEGETKEVMLPVTSLGKAQSLLAQREIESGVQIEYQPKNPVLPASVEVKHKLENLFAELDNQTDVTAIYSNEAEASDSRLGH
jgi:YebC/PmpR family DNA-binding regulatory protein